MAIFYTRDEEVGQSDVVVEYELIEFAPDVMTPKLVFLFFKPKENVEDFEHYFFTDELIDKLIRVEGLGFFAGARFLEGWVELYFYTNNSKLLRQKLAERLPPNLHHELSSKDDEHWKFFFEFLHPSEMEKLSIENRLVLEELEAAGDDLELPHAFDHTFFFHTPSQREKVKEELLKLGHIVEDETVDDTMEARFVLVTQHTEAATLSSVNAFSRQISEITERLKGYYDGWSTTMKEQI